MVSSFIGPRCSPHRCVQRVPSDADPVGTAQSIDGAKRALGSLLNVFNGTVALPAHWHLERLQPILLPFCTVTQLHRTLPAILGGSCLENIATGFRERWLPTTHLTGARAVAGKGEVMCSEGGDATFGKSVSAQQCCNLALKHWYQN